MTTTNEGTIQRDELAQLVMMTAVHPDLLDYRHGDYSSGAVCLGDARRIADKALAAGYRKPRMIESPQDLDGLPFGSVVLDYYEVAWTCSRRRVDGTLSEWLCTEFSELVDSHYVLQHGPVAVLHSPEATQ